MFEYDLYFPMGQRWGPKTVAEVFDRTRAQLANFFGGLTDFRHRSEGTWKYGGVEYRDEVVLLRALGRDRDAARRFLRSVQKQLERELQQKQILVVEREVTILA